MNFNIVELGGTKNGIFTRNKYVDKSKPNDLNNAMQEFDEDMYQTVYSYENTSINTCNFIAPLYLDLDIEDIDNNYDKLLRDLKILHRQLKILFKLEDKDIEIYFSGSKGFHVIVPYKVFGFTPSRNLNKDLKKIALYLKSYTITKCIDTKIYDYKRLFRVNNTKNMKTGLYKVKIPYNTLINMSWEELKQYAATPKRTGLSLYKYKEEANIAFYELIEKIDQKEKQKINMKMAHEMLRKKELLPCVKYILQNGATDGQRNNTTVALANSLFQIQHSIEEVMEIVHQWNKMKNEVPLPDNEINTTINSAYNNSNHNMFYGCSAFKDLGVCVVDCPIHK